MSAILEPKEWGEGPTSVAAPVSGLTVNNEVSSSGFSGSSPTAKRVPAGLKDKPLHLFMPIAPTRVAAPVAVLMM
jgi:hypothetical protein